MAENTTSGAPGRAQRRYSPEQIAYMNKLRAKGYTLREIAEAANKKFGVYPSVNTLQKMLNPGPSRTRLTQEKSSVRMTARTKERMREIAAEHGYVNTSGEFAGLGSIAHLLEAIANGEMVVLRRERREG